MKYSEIQLSSMSLAELEAVYKAIDRPTQEQKEAAWKKMDIGIYNEQGNLIGDIQMSEDGYDE